MVQSEGDFVPSARHTVNSGLGSRGGMCRSPTYGGSDRLTLCCALDTVARAVEAIILYEDSMQANQADGVFQGGGVKGLALAGALEGFADASTHPGTYINKWVQLAGTSAGQ